MTSSTTTLALDSDPAKLADLYPRLLALCSDDGLDDLAAFQLTTVIIEAINNSIEHGYNGEPGHTVSVCWHSDPNAVEIEIHDHGRPLPPEIIDQSVMPMPDAESGRGLAIIREWTDSASYDRIGDENVLKLKRRR